MPRIQKQQDYSRPTNPPHTIETAQIINLTVNKPEIIDSVQTDTEIHKLLQERLLLECKNIFVPKDLTKIDYSRTLADNAWVYVDNDGLPVRLSVSELVDILLLNQNKNIFKEGNGITFTVNEDNTLTISVDTSQLNIISAVNVNNKFPDSSGTIELLPEDIPGLEAYILSKAETKINDKLDSELETRLDHLFGTIRIKIDGGVIEHSNNTDGGNG